MKNTLEYKILKYLSENNDGKFIDISHLSESKILLESVIKDLKYREFIETQEYPGEPWKDPTWIGTEPSGKPEKCKIKLSGIEYLESLKPVPIPQYQKIYLPLFILFGFSTTIFAYLNYSSNHRNDILQDQLDTLKIENQIYKDSIESKKSQIELYKKKYIIDTLQNNRLNY